MKHRTCSSIECKHLCKQNPVFVLVVSCRSTPVWWLPGQSPWFLLLPAAPWASVVG